MGSSRLAGKVLATVAGRPMLWHVVERVRTAQSVAQVVVATPDGEKDAPLRKFCEDYGIELVAGSETDVLDRYYRAAVQYDADPLLRITADCPLVDPELVDRLVRMYQQGDWDYVAVAAGTDAQQLPNGRYPDGLDAECLSFAVLKQAWQEATDPLDREHATRFIWRQKDRFRCGRLTSPQDLGHLRLTVDYPGDLELIRKIYSVLYRDGEVFPLSGVVKLLHERADLITQVSE